MKIIIPSLVIILTVLCMFFISEYVNNLQIQAMGVDAIPFSYRFLSNVSSTFAALTPMIVFLFLYCTIEIMMNFFFEEKINRKDLYYILGIAFIPMLLFEYFYWLNLIRYCNLSVIKNIDEFTNMKFMFNLKMHDMKFINMICWGILYLIPILYFFLIKISHCIRFCFQFFSLLP